MKVKAPIALWKWLPVTARLSAFSYDIILENAIHWQTMLQNMHIRTRGSGRIQRYEGMTVFRRRWSCKTGRASRSSPRCWAVLSESLLASS